jgi:hypothetical protein
VGGLFVRINRTSTGGVESRGHDLNPNPFVDSDHEYVLTIRGDHTFDMIDALGGPAAVDPLDLIEANIGTIVRTG